MIIALKASSTGTRTQEAAAAGSVAGASCRTIGIIVLLFRPFSVVIRIAGEVASRDSRGLAGRVPRG